MKTVSWLLQTKGDTVWSATPETLVSEALKIMADRNIGALTVLEGERLVGMFSERDYARKVMLKGRSSRDTKVSDVMSTGVITVRPDQSIETCMELMTEKHIRHLPVWDKNRLLGIVSIGDVVKEIISEQKTTIRQLEEYITGRR